MTTVLRGRRVLTPAGLRPASLHLEDGRIVRIGGPDERPSGVPVLDLGELLVMPGVVDSHVHINEPGRTEWEGFASATRAAAAGGITTLCDMPLNSIPATTTVAALAVKRAAAQPYRDAHLEFIGGVVPGNTGELEPLARAGVCAFKCFLSPSGVPEFPSVSEADLREALPVLARTGRALMVHAEEPRELRPAPSGGSYAAYLDSRPVAAELAAIDLLVRLLERRPTPVHIVHLSSARSLERIRSARQRGLPLSAETCPHYLSFAAEEIPDGATEYKCAPPIREAAEREGLWRGLESGALQLIASDHSPAPPALKRTGDFASAWGGIASLQLSLPAVWTGARLRGIPAERLAEWLCAGPAGLVGLGDRRGRLAEGYEADIVAWDPGESFVVDGAALHHRHALTPYSGRRLYGRVQATWVGGRLVFGSL